ncbi:MAG: hypothetical protein EOO62_09365 [Hymenobacter sp.]|nr:MAG: hypothetical protein EOO62_09365 [Hymenobacter sp.]
MINSALRLHVPAVTGYSQHRQQYLLDGTKTTGQLGMAHQIEMEGKTPAACEWATWSLAL